MKTIVLIQEAAITSLQINKERTEMMRNLENETPVTLDNIELKEVDQFTYFESILTSNDYWMPEIKNRISKAADAKEQTEKNSGRIKT